MKLSIIVQTSERDLYSYLIFFGFISGLVGLNFGIGSAATVTSLLPEEEEPVMTRKGKKKKEKFKVVIYTVGTRGDVQPFLDFGKELIENRNCHVVICGFEVHRKLIESFGIGFHPVGIDKLPQNSEVRP